MTQSCVYDHLPVTTIDLGQTLTIEQRCGRFLSRTISFPSQYVKRTQAHHVAAVGLFFSLSLIVASGFTSGDVGLSLSLRERSSNGCLGPRSRLSCLCDPDHRGACHVSRNVGACLCPVCAVVTSRRGRPRMPQRCQCKPNRQKGSGE